MNEIEKRWLEYARNVLECPPSFNACCRRGEISTDRIVRWPGYLGPRYEEGRVLLVGAIHNELQLFTPQIKTFDAEVKIWLKSDRTDASDARYLCAQRKAYEQSFGQWTGRVWTNFRKLMREFKLDLNQTAFTNLAKCYLPPRDASVDKCVRACAGHYPIADLVCRLRPIAVLVAKSSKATDKFTPICMNTDESKPLVFRFNNRTGMLARWRVATLKEWAPEAAERYRQARRKER